MKSAQYIICLLIFSQICFCMDDDPIVISVKDASASRPSSSAVQLEGFSEILSPRHAAVFAGDLAQKFGLSAQDTDELKTALSGLRRAKHRAQQRENLTKVFEICGTIKNGKIELDEIADFIADHVSKGKNVTKPVIARNIKKMLSSESTSLQITRAPASEQQPVAQKNENRMEELLALFEQAKANDTLSTSNSRLKKVAVTLGTLAGTAALAFLTKLMTDFSLGGGDCSCECPTSLG